MCTLTFRRVAAGSDGSGPEAPGRPGYSLWFNRDERLTRGAEAPPTEARTPDGRRYLAPTDTDAGGTWIAANDAGLTVAILNGYIESRGPAPAEWISRGQLVRDVAAFTRASHLTRISAPRDLARYRPFVLVCVDVHGASRVLRWDGLNAVLSPDARAEVPFISSSYAQDAVQSERAAMYTAQIADPAAPTEAELTRFHAYVDPEDGPTAFTPSMRRGDAATRSQVRVDVTPEAVSMRYAPGPPHEAPLGKALVLPRA